MIVINQKTLEEEFIMFIAPHPYYALFTKFLVPSFHSSVDDPCHSAPSFLKPRGVSKFRASSYFHFISE